MIELRGITWDHDRGFAPLHATAQEYTKLHPEIKVHWDRRSLRDFAELSVLDLAKHYDLIVLDHPWIGAAVARESLLPWMSIWTHLSWRIRPLIVLGRVIPVTTIMGTNGHLPLTPQRK